MDMKRVIALPQVTENREDKENRTKPKDEKVKTSPD